MNDFAYDIVWNVVPEACGWESDAIWEF